MTRRGSGVQIPHGPPYAKENNKNCCRSYCNYDDCSSGSSIVYLSVPTLVETPSSFDVALTARVATHEKGVTRIFVLGS